jgi:hypothetical protein
MYNFLKVLDTFWISRLYFVRLIKVEFSPSKSITKVRVFFSKSAWHLQRNIGLQVKNKTKVSFMLFCNLL